MTTGLALLQPAGPQDLYAFLTEQLRPRLLRALEQAGAGQCLRVTTLPEPVMDRVCDGLQGDARWVARVLVASASNVPWKSTATKIIELRNGLGKPLLVFIPPDLRTAAEDSLDIATFTELSLATVAGELVEALQRKLPEPLRAAVLAEIAYLRTERHIRNADDEVMYLLTVLKNGATAAAAGAAMYVFDLLPDPLLFQRGNTRYWLTRNLKACERLVDAQPIQSSILRLPVKPNTIQAPLFTFLRSRQVDDIRSWARAIACDGAFRSLALDQWEFVEDGATESLRIILDPLTLPPQTKDQVSGAVPLPVLNLKGRDPLKVAFRCMPPPGQHASLKTFRAQILSVSGGVPSVAWEGNNFPKPKSPKTARVSRSIKIADLQSLEEGTYFLKVDGYDADGALVTTSRRIDAADPNSRAENESERFLVVNEDVPVEERDVRAVFVPSLLTAWTEVAAQSLGARRREPVPSRKLLRGDWDAAVGAPPRGDVHFELTTEGFAGYSIVVPSILRKLELALLDNPDRTGLHALTFTNAKSIADVAIEHKEAADLGNGPLVDAFLAARRAVFQAILIHHFDAAKPTEENQAMRRGVVETIDLVPYEDLIDRYATAFVELARSATAADQQVERRAARTRALAHLDAVELRWRRSTGDPGRAMLVAPTHPLRLLWHLQHEKMCDGAAEAWEDGSESVPSWRSFLSQIEEGLLPMGLPMVIFDGRGRGYVEHTPITRFWPLYLPDRGDEETQIDAVAARDRILHAMGIKDRTVAVTTVDPDEVAGRLLEYVLQHPYVEQLRINVFNPGDGRTIAEVLRRLEGMRVKLSGRDSPSLRYAVHLFAAAEHLDVTGEGLESLLDPDRQVGEDDEFTLAASNHLLPKLVFARNAVGDFLQAPERFAAHVSILLEQFIVRSRVENVGGLRRGSYVGGLVQEPEMQVEVVGSHFGWVKGLRPKVRGNAGLREKLLRDAVDAAQQVQASFALGQPVTSGLAPVVALQLDPENQALLKQVHDVSDWVLTIDRNLGLEYFDSPSSVRDAGYLLDFAPEYLQEDRQRILLTTRSTAELEGLIRPVMNAYGLEMQAGDEILILETMRSLSGRLALRLEAGQTQAAEVVGLLLARWLLERAGVLDHRVVIPLDAHRSWFTTDGEDTTSKRRADLLLVGFKAPSTLLFDVVEVKLRDELSHVARSQLYAEMREQTENSERRLRELFDLDFYLSRQRADRLLRAKELMSALAFYIRRANRYELLPAVEADALLHAVENLDDGYSLEMRSLGVVFERKGSGSHIDEEEPGFPVYRFGGDKARQLLADAAGRLVSRFSRISDRTGGTGQQPPAQPVARTELASQLTDAEIGGLRSTLVGKTGQSSPPARVQPYPQTAAKDALPARTPPPAYEVPPPAAAPAAPNGGATAAAAPAKLIATDGTTSTKVVTATVTATDTPPPAASPAPTPSVSPPSGEPAEPAVPPPAPIADVLLGATEITAQYGLIGKAGSQRVGIDLNGPNTVSLFGVQGFGKSYTLGVIAEMATTRATGINVLPSPLATVLFHYHKSDAYEPEHAAAVQPNRKLSELERLKRDYGANPVGLSDVVLLTPEAKVAQRRQDYPGIQVEPIKFRSGELDAEGWKFLLGAYGNDALYVRQLIAIMRRHRSGLTLDKFRQEIQDADLSKSARKLAEDRLNLAEPYVDDSRSLATLLRPGRTVIVDLRDEWIEKDEALGLFVVMLRIFAAAKFEGKPFNKLVVFDEAHKYITESDLIGQVVETIREMRHQATSVVIASQDPLSVPRAVIELTSVLILHRMTSPQWLKHLKTAITALEGIEEGHLTALAPGEALVWAQRSTDKRFMQRPQKLTIRPRFTQHGGGTKTAVAGATVR